MSSPVPRKNLKLREDVGGTDFLFETRANMIDDSWEIADGMVGGAVGRGINLKR